VARQIQLEILSPTRLVFAGPVESIVLPSVEGLMGVLPGHARLLAVLSPGNITARPARSPADGHASATLNSLAFVVSGGFARVRPDRVTVLADEAPSAG